MERLLVTHAGGYLGDRPPINKKGNNMETNFEEALYPPEVADKKVLTNVQLKELQDEADRLDLLLPPEFNRSVASGSKYSDDEIEKLLPPGMCINCD
jgi:hypothetical protein